MRRGAIVGCVLVLVLVPSAAAQPSPDPAPPPPSSPPQPYTGKVGDKPSSPPQPYTGKVGDKPSSPQPRPYDSKVRDVDDPNNKHPAVIARREAGEYAWVEPPFRVAWGGGISGPVLEYTNLYEGTVGFEGVGLTRVNTWTSLGLHLHLSLRNWAAIGKYYSGLTNEEHHDGAEAYGFLFGWLAGTGMLATGPEVMLGRSKESRGWVSFGTTFFVFIDANDNRLKDGVVLGHGAKFSTGIDINRDIGIGFHLRWAPSDGLTIFGTNGPSILAMMATFEIRTDGKDKKKNK